MEDLRGWLLAEVVGGCDEALVRGASEVAVAESLVCTDGMRGDVLVVRGKLCRGAQMGDCGGGIIGGTEVGEVQVSTVAVKATRSVSVPGNPATVTGLRLTLQLRVAVMVPPRWSSAVLTLVFIEAQPMPALARGRRPEALAVVVVHRVYAACARPLVGVPAVESAAS